ncbi:putative sodium bile acid cotransporter, partial [Pelagophyceae sp. CCMP2097]
FADANFFVLGMLISVVAAKAFPGVCVDGGPLKPEFVVGQLGVAAVFLLSGLSIKLNELKTAVLNVKFNAVVQGTSLLAIPLASAAGVALLRQTTPIHPKLLDGLLATACLPTTVNMCVILTTSAGGNVAASLANAVMGNFLGIFVTPALLLGLLAATADVPLLAIVRKLFAKVVLPVVAGQLLRSWKPLLELQQRRSGAFKRMSEIVLLLIVWNAFSNSFTAGLAIPLRDLAILGAFVPALHLGTLLGLKSFYSKFFDPRDAVAGAFVASHKTLAFGLPLLKLVFAGSPDLGYLCAPLLLLHPSQLLVGSLLVP